MVEENKTLKEKENYQGCCGLCYSDRDVEQAVKEAYAEIVSMSGIYSVSVKRIFKDKFGFDFDAILGDSD